MRYFFSLLALTLASFASAEQMIDTGEYIVHYSALSTENVPAPVASAYGITRSKNQGMVNITVLRKTEDGVNEHVEAKVAAAARNLSGQRRTIDFELVTEQDANYYIGTFRVANEEHLTFTVEVVLPGEADPLEFTFSQKFYTD